MPAESPKYRAPALDKGLDILELLARATQPLSIAEISEGVGRSRGEIFRMLQVLEERDYIARPDGEGAYSLTPRLFRLGMEQPPVKNLVETAMPVMHRLADDIDQSCHLVVPSQEQIVVIARVDPPGETGLVVRVGHRRPMSHSASGYVLLAWQTDDIRQRWLRTLLEHEPGLKRAKIEATVKDIRAAGLARIPSEVVDGVTDLSAPIVEGNHAVCALTVPFLARRGAKVDMKATSRLVMDAAAEISRELSHGAPGAGMA
ncbi:IclR family transcriptional regulator [Luteibacter aegosomatis]|uniref:IclR family transcriptional regulator n=1 Tax=Luteibacter aegosomatis TaxID=2911537 RepID=UPI001FF7A58B|nr:IclR family transcriptional regulator [Luteibacter aegosomatis]UPG87687.1 IclR family transcriptional regulator [Luteibacter aegosomatis]